MTPFKKILCVMPPEAAYKPALERAVSLTEINQAVLTVITVLEHVPSGIALPGTDPTGVDLQAATTQEREETLEALIGPYRQRIAVQAKVLIGTPFLEVIREVLRSGHDLVMKVADTHEWLDRLIGSDDLHLLRKCPCPVWLMQPKEPVSYRRILAAVDVNDAYPLAELETRRALNRRILDMAVSLALADFAELHVTHAWTAIAESALRGAFLRKPEAEIVAYVEQVRRHHEANLAALMHQLTGNLGADALNYLRPQTHLLKGWARKEVPALARRIEADLVVMGTVARTGIPGLIMGNTAETILNQIACSVLAVKPPGFVTPVTLDVQT